MPNFGADGILARDEIEAVADHVLALSGEGQSAEDGARIFADNCAACHGEDGTGNRDMGAPNLADAISLYGAARESVLIQLTRARHGVMPAWAGRLSDAELKQLAHFVHGLGGGE
jgi:cytochrome c oxidase cbb3-type subunit 3